MIIHINDRFRIASEGTAGWAIQEARTVRGERRWEGRWWYPTFDIACRAFLDHALLSREDEVGVRGAIQAIREARADLVAALACRSGGGVV